MPIGIMNTLEGLCLFPTLHSSFAYVKPECALSDHDGHTTSYKHYQEVHPLYLAARENRKNRCGAAENASNHPGRNWLAKKMD